MSELVRSADAGKLAVVLKQGKPVLVLVPIDELLIEVGWRRSLAKKLDAEA